MISRISQSHTLQLPITAIKGHANYSIIPGRTKGRKIMNICEINDAICESVSEIKFALSNLTCVRISAKGNEDVVPNPETLDNALYSVELMIERETDNIYKLLDKLAEKETQK